MSGVWLVTFLAALAVEGDAECPRPAELEARVGSVTQVTHRAQITARGERDIELTLFDERGARIATRSLHAASCQGLLEAAAATLLAWEASLPPPPPPPRRAPIPIKTAPVTIEPEPAPRTRSWRVELGVTGALVGLAPTAGLTLAALAGPDQARWRGRLHVSGLLPVEATVANGRVAWTRPAAGLGVSLRVLDLRVALELSAALEAAVLVTWGRGFEQNAGAVVFDPAGDLSLRASTPLTGGLEAFLQLSLTAGFIQQTVRVTGVDVVLPLPPLTTGLRLGLAFGG